MRQAIIRRGFFPDPFVELFSDLDFSLRGLPNNTWRPAEDMIEQEDCSIIRLDVPGIKKEDLQVQLQEGVLTVSGQRQSESQWGNGGYQRFERSGRSFSRSYRVSEGLDKQEIQANLQDGVLELRVPKPEHPEPQQIEIGNQLTLQAASETVDG